jgi:hypothetical protein
MYRHCSISDLVQRNGGAFVGGAAGGEGGGGAGFDELQLPGRKNAGRGLPTPRNKADSSLQTSTMSVFDQLRRWRGIEVIELQLMRRILSLSLKSIPDFQYKLSPLVGVQFSNTRRRCCGGS